MITGTPYGGDRAHHYWRQTNNSAEYMIRAVKAEIANKLLAAGVDRAIVDAATRGYLESCGMDAMVNCAMALVQDVPTVLTPAGTDLPLDDLAMMIINSPDHAAEVREILPGFNGDVSMENRVMQLHPLACRLMFGNLVKGECVRGLNYDDVMRMIQSHGSSIEINLPGHYVAAVLVDAGVGILINDSWGARKGEWNGDGFNRPLPREEFATAHTDFVVYRRIS